jgi:hypothetical protein
MRTLKGQTWASDDIPLRYAHVFGSEHVTGEDIALFQDRFAPHLPLQADPAASAALGPAAAQADVYALWSRMLWHETKDWPVLARLGQDALRW